MSNLFDFDNDGVVSEEEDEEAFLLLMDDDDEEEEEHPRTGGCLTVFLLVLGSITMLTLALVA